MPIATDDPGRRSRDGLLYAILALLLGTIALILSYVAIPEHTFLHDFFHEVGFALLVAVIIWGTFEFFTHAANDDRWNERIERIARNVFIAPHPS